MRITLLSFLLFVALSSFGNSGKLYVVAIGVSDYAEISDLKYCDSDASEVAALFNLTKHPHEIVLLRNGEATKSAILLQLSNLFSKASGDDIILFYFSGHGGKGFFCPYDANEKNLLTYDNIRKLLIDCKAKRQLLIADACNSGAIRITVPENTIKNTGQRIALFPIIAKLREINGTAPDKRWRFYQFLIERVKRECGQKP